LPVILTRGDLPDLRDEGQADSHARPHKIRRHQKRPSVYMARECARYGRSADIDDHIDSERRALHHCRIVARQIIGQKPECYGGTPGARQNHDLRGKEMAIGAVGKNFQQGADSKVSRYGFQLVAICRRMRGVEAMIHVVVDQGTLGVLKP